MQKRLGPGRAYAPMDQHDGLAGSPQFVLQLETVDSRPLHLIAAVAEEARVSPETIYLTLGGKRGLLEGVIEEYSCGVLARTRPVHTVIREAADKETFAAALGRRLLN